MALMNMLPYETGELSDKLTDKLTGCHDIVVGNCRVSYVEAWKTFSFTTTSDDEYPLKSIENFRRILDYIEITYGS